MWVLMKVGVLGDGGNLVRLLLGELIPERGLGTGYLVKLLLSNGGVFLSSSSKLARGP